MSKLTNLLIFFIFTTFIYVSFVVVAQEDINTNTKVYLCIIRQDSYDLMEIQATEPISLIFSQNINLIVYSDPGNNLVTDVIYIEPETTTGTYRYTGHLVQDAHTTSAIPIQSNCEEEFAGELSALERTILLPLTPEQAIVVHNIENTIPYENEEVSLFIGAIGILFRDENPEFPHFQILRVTGGSNDTISFKFPYFTQDTTRLYAVSEQVVEHTFTNNTVESQPKFMENRAFFLSLLAVNGDDLLDNILAPGDFRFYVQYGEEIIYRQGTWQNFSRLSSFVPRNFVAGQTIVDPIYCNTIPFFRQADYSQQIYSQNLGEAVGIIRCGQETVVEEVLPNGILVVEGGFYIASWLVDIVE